MSLVENEPQNNLMEAGIKRTRKLAIGHHDNNILLDANGNARTFNHLDRVSEIMPNLSSQCDVTDENYNHERNSKVWENSVLQQIQTLIKNVQVSDTIADLIQKEILNGTDVNANIGHRLRRKSCFSMNQELQAHPSRRQSVTTLCQNKSKSLPRTVLNNIGLYDLKHYQQERQNNVVHDNGRRISNAGHIQRRRSSVASQNAVRRSSVVHPSVHVTGPGGRRNSVAHFCGRRNSLAHAYQHSTMPSLRRMSCVNDNLTPFETGEVPQRRRSSVKPPCFPVTKIASVQKRLHRIYNRRKRRQDRREVNIADVRKAFRSFEKDDCSVTGESEENSSGNNNSKTGSDSETSEGRSNNSDEDIRGSAANKSETVINAVAVTVRATDSLVDNEGELKPNPRRKTSIQVRSWELSRRLRQRRREKRKGFTESDLI